MKQVMDFRNGRLEIRGDSPTLLREINEKLTEILKSVDKTLTNRVPNEKAVSNYVSQPLVFIGAEEGTRTPTGTTSH